MHRSWQVVVGRWGEAAMVPFPASPAFIYHLPYTTYHLPVASHVDPAQ